MASGGSLLISIRGWRIKFQTYKVRRMKADFTNKTVHENLEHKAVEMS